MIMIMIMIIVYCSESSNVTWSVHEASSLSEGYYMCNASNSAGWATATTYLDVKGPFHSLRRCFCRALNTWLLRTLTLCL